MLFNKRNTPAAAKGGTIPKRKGRALQTHEMDEYLVEAQYINEKRMFRVFVPPNEIPDANNVLRTLSARTGLEYTHPRIVARLDQITKIKHV